MQSRLDIEFLRQTQLYRPSRPGVDADFTGRNRPVDNLLAAGYSFLPCHYGRDGVLFRGMQSGLGAALSVGTFGHFEGMDEMCRVERAMGVYFLSNEISDAVTVSRLHEKPPDAGIIVISASWFNGRLRDDTAAVLAVGDAGIVFRYPFVTDPVPAEAVRAVFVPESAAALREPGEPAQDVITVGGGNRKELEQDLDRQMQMRGMRGAAAFRTDDRTSALKGAAPL